MSQTVTNYSDVLFVSDVRNGQDRTDLLNRKLHVALHVLSILIYSNNFFRAKFSLPTVIEENFICV